MHLYALVASAIFTICESMPTDPERDNQTPQNLDRSFSKYFSKYSDPGNDVNRYTNKLSEGDMNHEELPESKLRQGHNPQMKNRRKRSVSQDPERLWNNPEIEYEISNTDYDKVSLATIAAAFRHIEQRSCLRFVPRRTHSTGPNPFAIKWRLSTPYIYIRKYNSSSEFCSSGIGRSPEQDKQELYLGTDCMYMGMVVHEILHILGFHHEQSREDRDTYVTVHRENVMDKKWKNFKTYKTNYLGQPYDYNSIMHYSERAQGKNRTQTIVPTDKTAFIGQDMGLSVLDAKKINLLFKCSTRDRYRDMLLKAWQELGEELKITKKKLPPLPRLPLSDCPANLMSETKCLAWQSQGLCRSPELAMACPRVCGNSGSCRWWADYGYCDDEHRKDIMRKLCYCAC